VRYPAEEIAAQAAGLRELLAGIPGVAVEEGLDMPVVQAPREQLLVVLGTLRDQGRYGHCSMITAVDRLPEEPRFEVVYGLYSLEHNRWLRVRTRCPEEDPEVDSATPLWPGANWFERECFDMFGIRFRGHPDLRRILMPEDYSHHPLRKDFPRQGIEPDRLYREWDAARRRQELDA